MTTYAYKLTLNDGETMMLKESLKLMIKKCNLVLKEAEANPNKQIAPYFTHKRDAERLLKRLYDNKTLTSVSFF